MARGRSSHMGMFMAFNLSGRFSQTVAMCPSFSMVMTSDEKSMTAW